MIMDAKKISEIIRKKKIKVMKAEPELVHPDARVEMDPNDMMNIEQQARIEATLDTPHKIDAQETDAMQSEHDAQTMGLTEDEKKRMGRLHKYFSDLGM